MMTVSKICERKRPRLAPMQVVKMMRHCWTCFFAWSNALRLAWISWPIIASQVYFLRSPATFLTLVETQGGARSGLLAKPIRSSRLMYRGLVGLVLG